MHIKRWRTVHSVSPLHPQITTADNTVFDSGWLNPQVQNAEIKKSEYIFIEKCLHLRGPVSSN